MTRRRIIAHFMHEKEMAAAKSKMTQVNETESYLLGEIEEADIPDLEKQGLIVQVLEDQPEAETAAGESEPHPGVRRRKIMLAATGPVAAPQRAIDLEKPNFYLIRLKGPILEAWRQELAKLGVQLLEYVPRYNYAAKLTPSQVRTVTDMPFVAGVRLYGPEDTGPIAMMRAIKPSPPTVVVGVAMLTYDILLHREEDLNTVLDWLRDHHVAISGATGRKIRVYLLENSPLLQEIPTIPEVARAEEYVPPKLHNDVARLLLGIDLPPGGNPNISLQQTGDGQIVGVADTGIDESHADFRGRLVRAVALGRPNDYSDPHGHGTHVAGSVLGDGTASGGTIKGAAPKAKLFFQSLLSADGGLGGLPLNLGDLFEEAYKAGARVHNNSWGAATTSNYTINSMEVDEFVAKRRDMLIVISAGNDGQAANRANSPQGFVDWLSIGSPATSKNALTVGASRSSRTSGGYSTLTYGKAWPQEFPDPPIANDTISGNSEGLAAFSSRGPCDDRRIKPDVVVPGTDIASTKSSDAPLRNFWGPYPNNLHYAFMGGTSMAAPLVSGCAALVREYYVGVRHHDPSAALLKATLINGTRWLIGSDAIADHRDTPNYHQGFGCIHMPWTIPNPLHPNLKLDFLDTWKETQRQFARSGQGYRLQFSVSGGEWLRLCLVWTDLPARALQNNLNLFVQNLRSGRKWMGNEGLPSSLNIPDPDNNVEIVRIPNPEAGQYLVQISATNLLKGGQDFALVVTGELSSQLSPF